MIQITITLDDELLSSLEKRAKKTFQSATELCTNIVRRSMLSWKNKNTKKQMKTDDKLVNIFSRSKRGRK